MHESMWMFVRGGEALWLVRRHVPPLLTVLGPGTQRQEYGGYLDAELTLIQARVETDLRSAGWALESVSPDRREGFDRRSLDRGGDRRRTGRDR